MNLQEFHYVKANGKESERTVVVLREPNQNTNVFGIDVTDLDLEEFTDFVSEVTELKRRQKEELEALMATYDLKHNFRNFKQENMTNVTKTEL